MTDSTKKIAKLENERRKLKQKCNSLRKKIARRSRKKENSSTLNRKTTNMMRAAGILPEDAPDIKKQLLFAETISREIQEAGKEKKNRKQSIRSMVSGNILNKYRLIRYTATKTNTDQRKLSKVKSKVVNQTKSKRGFEPKLYKTVVDFYYRDDVSIALPGKRDAKKSNKGSPASRNGF